MNLSVLVSCLHHRCLFDNILVLILILIVDVVLILILILIVGVILILILIVGVILILTCEH
jgi:hypothetical protein